ncbi:LAGLIDADG family homing endonuclease [Halovenus sp. HT40]|uniref:LAGLIDADG family homing endonuclease n=1 Tax=Halovenus sp. HT40 TaxID=3126691 RepID=UPI00300F1BF5
MARADDTELIDSFEEFYRSYYRNEIAELAQKYPNEQKSLYIDWQDLYRFDSDLADDFRNKPDQLREYAEEALRLYDLPVDVSLGQAHVRLRNLPETTDIRGIRSDHRGMLISVQGIIRKATDVRPKITTAAFECQRCGTLTRIPQEGGDFQEPHECQGCERQGPFRINYDQSEFIDAQKLRVQESPEGLRGGETPQNIDVNIEDDITGEVTPGDHVTATGILKLEQQGNDREKSAMFDVYMEGLTIDIEDEQFEEMEITDEDKKEIVELSNQPDIYDEMVGAIAPSIYGYEKEKKAMAFQLFSGVTKFLPDGSRTRGDLHILLVGDPGTGKCLKGDANVTLSDGRQKQIRDLVEENLDDPKPVDDGVYDTVDIPVPSLTTDGQISQKRATKVWKREAPDQMYQITTASGRELEVTPSHPLFVQSRGEFVPEKAENLNTGEFVAVPEQIPTDSETSLNIDYRRSEANNAVRLELPDTWEPWLARLIGYIIAEGNASLNEDNTGTVFITNNDSEVLADIEQAYDRLGLTHSERAAHSGKTAKEIICTASEFVSFLENLAPAILESSAQQRVPDAIQKADWETQRNFLKAYIEGEGHVSAKQREISVASKSRELLEGVRSLLGSVGIHGSLDQRQNGSYRLRLSGEDFTRYVDEVGFVTERKSTASAVYDGVEKNTNTNVVPEVGELLGEIREKLALTQFDCGIPRTTYQHYERGDRNPSRESLATVVKTFEERIEQLRTLRKKIENGDWDAIQTAREELNISQRALSDQMEVTQTAVSYYEREDVAPDGGKIESATEVVLSRIQNALSTESDIEQLSKLANGGVRWEKIQSIETITPDYEWVYDLEVAETHNYISDGVISHNSQLLQYIKDIAPRSVYTSGKGSSSAGLTAAAVRDDFGEGQQWTLEAGALVLADQGIAAVDELDKMRCVTGDTMVHTSDGITPIREFARRFEEDGSVEELENGQTIRDIDARVWTMTERGEIVQRPVTAVHEYNAPETVLDVSLESGESVTATEDHPFFVLSDGEQTTKPASELEDGDWVYVPDSMEHTVPDGGAQTAMPPNSSTAGRSDARISTPRAAILGYIAGDGNIYYSRDDGSYGIRFTNAEEELLRDFERSCRDAFEDADPARYPSEQRDDGVGTVRLHGKRYADTLLDCGLNIENYDGKRVPEPVTAASKSAKAAFIRALADSEGSVGERNVRISSSSYELLLGTKMLLLEFDITSQIQTREYETKRDLYVLAVTADESLRRFRNEIGFTLSRKAQALVSVCERTTGDRTILDVLPECGPLFEEARSGLRLHQAECGLVDSTYCNFENGDANCSLRAARRVLETFEQRKKQAKADLDALSNPHSWEEVTELRQQYHVSQSELSVGIPYSQQQISRYWGDSDELKQSVRERLRSIIADVADTSFARLRSLINNDVKWRRVSNVESTTADVGEGQIRLQQHRLAELLDCPVENTADRAKSLLSTDLAASDWDELSAVLDAHAVSFGRLADRFDVAPSTISRWFNECVDGEDFTTVREVAFELLSAKRNRIRRLYDTLTARQEPSVYDLTVEGTHNFIANGVVVHNSEDQSAMHEALEQQSISVSKAGINATLKSRCSLLGAANPTYGRFDEFEPIGEQIDLAPPLISRFDLIFTVTDQPDEEKDNELAEHILQTNYAGELNTHRTETSTSNYTKEEVERVTEDVAPTIDAEFLRKYVAYAQRNCYPTMTEEAKSAIQDFYVELRMQGSDEDAPVPVTARKLEAMVRLAEASARVRLSDTVTEEDAQRAIEIARYSLEDIGLDPETGELDADMIETGTSKSQRDRIKNVLQLIESIEDEYDEGAPVDVVIERAEEEGMDTSKAEHEIDKLKQKGEVYEPRNNHLRTT